jgi:PAS domain S-box-containing protein
MMVNTVQLRGSKKEPYRRLADINRAITNSLDFDQILNLIVENTAQLFDADASVLLLADRDQRLRIRASVGMDKDQAANFSARIEEDVVRTLHTTMGLKDADAIASVPIIAKQALNGLLVIARQAPLSEDEEWQMAALADQAAIALRNARLYEMELAEANRERDETMDALRDSNSRIGRILESITDLFYQLDRDWRFTDVNRQTELRFGKTRNEMIGRVIWEVFPQAVDSSLFHNFRRAAEENVPVHFEVASQIVPGAFFEAHAYPSRSGLTVYLRDISERKQGEVTSHLLASIVESSEDAIISKDLDGKISSWNRGAERIFGYTADEAIGRNITILIPPDRLEEEPAILERIRAGRYVEHFETVRRRKNGELIEISVSISPIRDEEGNIVGASKIARDVTAQRKAENEIRFQARLLDAVEQAVIATNLEGTITYWNDFAERLYGWPAELALGASVMDLIPAVDAKEKAEEIFKTLKAGDSWSGEMLVKRRDGTVFPAMITDSPITNVEGDLIGIVGVSVDIAEEKETEAERKKLLERAQRARNEAETANRLKDEFLATLSHELRNPLNVVIGYAEILRRSDESRNDGFITRIADVIRRNALAQSQLVSDLLDLSRLQMGKLSIKPQPVSLSTIVADAIETVKEEAEAKNISLNLNVADEVIIVYGDPVRLGQIAWNLLNNAVKFTLPGGQITISLSQSGSDAQLTIEDSGQGISPGFLPHVFEIFRQADASSARRQGGLGIGLALVKQLTELHGGRVEAESEGVGRGAKFNVWFPVYSRGNALQSFERQTNTGVLNQKSILVVDDSSETTEMLSRLLQMEGAYVQTARSGLEALQYAESRKFDLVISDISMPEMDGYQLLQKLRELPSMVDVPVLALTGYGRTSDVNRARKEGFAEHFTKPLDIEKLLQTVKALTNGHPQS